MLFRSRRPTPVPPRHNWKNRINTATPPSARNTASFLSRQNPALSLVRFMLRLLPIRLTPRSPPCDRAALIRRTVRAARAVIKSHSAAPSATPARGSNSFHVPEDTFPEYRRSAPPIFPGHHSSRPKRSRPARRCSQRHSQPSPAATSNG